MPILGMDFFCCASGFLHLQGKLSCIEQEERQHYLFAESEV
jgi:hypothetical protein